MSTSRSMGYATITRMDEGPGMFGFWARTDDGREHHVQWWFSRPADAARFRVGLCVELFYNSMSCGGNITAKICESPE